MRHLEGKKKWFFNIIAIIWSIYLLYSAMYPVHPIPQVSICSGFALVLCFALFPLSKKWSSQSTCSVLDWLCMVAAVACCGYMAVKFEYFLINPMGATSFDIMLGTILLLLILEAARRSMGLIIPIMTIVFLLYTFD